MNNKRVLISVTNEHWIHKTVVRRMLQLMMDGRYKNTIIMPSHKPYENNLHHIVNDVLKDGYDFWLNIDSDNPPERNPLDLVALNKDVIGLPTPVIHFDGKGTGDAPVYLNAYDYVPGADAYRPHSVFRGLRKVDAVGTGCVLFARRVFEHPEMQKGCFTRKLNPDGTVERGNDISFCERARENGFEIYAHYDYYCDHFSETSINEMVAHYSEFFDKQLVTEGV
jgi:hypothetical protein|tara:strand:- start:760 stop:1431 length:672 start_codon:yes stop_codon:yes gene_type:complete